MAPELACADGMVDCMTLDVERASRHALQRQSSTLAAGVGGCKRRSDPEDASGWGGAKPTTVAPPVSDRWLTMVVRTRKCP